MADIQFRPVCSNCNSIINDTVNLETYNLETYVTGQDCMQRRSCFVRPSFCSKCGELFERIIMPTRLPFEPEMLDVYMRGDSNG